MPDLVLRWSPIPGTAQESFFDDDSPEATLLFKGGWGSGKTTALIAKMLKLSAINHPLPGIWVVPTWQHIHKTLLPSLTDVDPLTGEPWFLGSDQYHYNQQKQVLDWAGGGPIWFQSAENPDSIAGPNVAYCGTDEPGSIKQKAWRNTVARVRHPAARLRQKVASGTPEGLNFLAELFGPDRHDDYHVYTMRTTDNPHLPASYLEQVRANVSEAELAAYLDGQFVNMVGSLAYPAFDPDRQVRGLHLNPSLPLRVAFDFNIDPMSAVIGQQFQGPSGLEFHVDRAIALMGSSVYQICAEVLKHYPTWAAGVVVYGDSTGANRSQQSLRSNYDIIRDELKAIGPLTMRVPKDNPAVTTRLNSVNRLCRDARGVVRLFLHGDPLKPKSSPTRALIQSLQQTVKKPGTDDLWKKAGETVTHLSDALGYWLTMEAPATKPDAGVAVIKAPNGSGPTSQALAAIKAEKSQRLRRELEALREAVH